MFIPSGWWHAVLNTEEPSVAVTQNYVDYHALPYVRRELERDADDDETHPRWTQVGTLGWRNSAKCLAELGRLEGTPQSPSGPHGAVANVLAKETGQEVRGRGALRPVADPRAERLRALLLWLDGK